MTTPQQPDPLDRLSESLSADYSESREAQHERVISESWACTRRVSRAGYVFIHYLGAWAVSSPGHYLFRPTASADRFRPRGAGRVGGGAGPHPYQRFRLHVPAGLGQNGGAILPRGIAEQHL